MRPQLGNNNLQIQGFMNNGQAVDMAAAAWINEPKEMKGDPAAQAAIQQIHDIMLQHRLTVNISIQAKQGEERGSWPKIGSWNLFPNRKPEDQPQQPPQQNYQQPPQQQQWQQQPAPQQQPQQAWQQPQQQPAPWQRG